MNIEEERKAFEASVVANKIVNGIGITSEWDGSRYVSKFGSSKPYAQAMFEVWLSAKEHVEEMAKPTVKVSESSNNGWCVYLVGNGSFIGLLCWDFETEAAAKRWALFSNYRVIE